VLYRIDTDEKGYVGMAQEAVIIYMTYMLERRQVEKRESYLPVCFLYEYVL